MESKLKNQENSKIDVVQKINDFEKYDNILQNYIDNLESNETIGISSTSEFNTTNCRFLQKIKD